MFGTVEHGTAHGLGACGLSAGVESKRKQFLKGVEQIAQEGAIQIFKTPYTGMEEVIVGVVGTLQFDVLEYRLRSEYNVELYKEGLPTNTCAGSYGRRTPPR